MVVVEKVVVEVEESEQGCFGCIVEGVVGVVVVDTEAEEKSFVPFVDLNIVS